MTSIQIPVDSLSWKGATYILRTPLGEDECEVLALDREGDLILKPGEDERIRKAQLRLFCLWAIENNETITKAELQYMLLVLGIRQNTLANALVVSPAVVSQYLSGETQTDRRSKQIANALLREVRAPGILSMEQTTNIPESLIESAPANEMCKRGWITSLGKFGDWRKELLSFCQPNLAACYRKSQCFASQDEPIVWWVSGIVHRVKSLDLPPFVRETFLARYGEVTRFCREPQHISEAIRFINSLGVAVLIEPNFKGMHLDGCVFETSEQPVIVLTLRYNRIDNFWFTFMHELEHIAHDHLKNGLIADDLKGEPTSDIEKEANSAAAARLILFEVIEEFRQNRCSPTWETIVALSRRLERHPSILVGQLKNAQILPYESFTSCIAHTSEFIEEFLTEFHRKQIEKKSNRQEVKKKINHKLSNDGIASRKIVIASNYRRE